MGRTCRDTLLTSLAVTRPAKWCRSFTKKAVDQEVGHDPSPCECYQAERILLAVLLFLIYNSAHVTSPHRSDDISFSICFRFVRLHISQLQVEGRNYVMRVYPGDLWLSLVVLHFAGIDGRPGFLGIPATVSVLGARWCARCHARVWTFCLLQTLLFSFPSYEWVDVLAISDRWTWHACRNRSDNMKLS